jgi:hypothetical protein
MTVVVFAQEMKSVISTVGLLSDTHRTRIRYQFVLVVIEPRCHDTYLCR